VKDGANDGVDAAGDNDQPLSRVDERLTGDLYRRSSYLHSSTPRPASTVNHPARIQHSYSYTISTDNCEYLPK